MRHSMPVVLLATALVACATTGGGKGPVREYHIDQVVPLDADKSAKVALQAGPFEVTELRIDNQISEEDLREDKRGTSRDHPKPVIVARSSAKSTARVSLASILEDGNGRALMTCGARKDQDLAPGATEDWNTCMMEGMRTQDWPFVKAFHVIVTFRVAEDAPAAQ